LRLIEEIRSGKIEDNRTTQGNDKWESEDEEKLVGAKAKIALMHLEEDKTPKHSKIRMDIDIPKPHSGDPKSLMISRLTMFFVTSTKLHLFADSGEWCGKKE